MKKIITLLNVFDVRYTYREGDAKIYINESLAHEMFITLVDVVNLDKHLIIEFKYLLCCIQITDNTPIPRIEQKP